MVSRICYLLSEVEHSVIPFAVYGNTANGLIGIYVFREMQQVLRMVCHMSSGFLSTTHLHFPDAGQSNRLLVGC